MWEYHSSVVLRDLPANLVIGTGYYGCMEVPAETVAKLRSHGIRLFVAPTKDAMEDFNRLLQKGDTVVAALHLTC